MNEGSGTLNTAGGVQGRINATIIEKVNLH